ncbi:TetR/AcrR family transcriptional regulator [Clostridium sp. UBA1056]|uniref:TetR/AcrR family transcriptional regulator n=1 Tax=unclassified Clostridium TaxID=2614128 RepID=UPI0032174BD0
MVENNSNYNTKKLLSDALKRMMTKKPLEKITIKEIVDLCNLNRRTFYYHFQDIYQLLEWIYKEEAVNQIEVNNSYSKWQDGLIYLFKYIERDKEVSLCAFHSLGREYLEKFLYSVTYRVTREIVDEVSEDLDVNSSYKDFVAYYYTVSLVGMVIHWIQSGMNEEPETIAEFIRITIQGTMRKALERFENLEN